MRIPEHLVAASLNYIRDVLFGNPCLSYTDVYLKAVDKVKSVRRRKTRLALNPLENSIGRYSGTIDNFVVRQPEVSPEEVIGGELEILEKLNPDLTKNLAETLYVPFKSVLFGDIVYSIPNGKNLVLPFETMAHKDYLGDIEVDGIFSPMSLLQAKLYGLIFQEYRNSEKTSKGWDSDGEIIHAIYNVFKPTKGNILEIAVRHLS